MFFRFKKSGQRTYIQIVENKRVDGAVRQSVIANLGRADELAASGALASLLATGGVSTLMRAASLSLEERTRFALALSLTESESRGPPPLRINYAVRFGHQQE